MLAAMEAMLERRVSLMLMSHMRRRWPLTRLVPAAVIVPLLAPVSRRVRRSVVRVAAAGLVAASVASAVLLTARW